MIHWIAASDENWIPLHGREGVKELRERLEHVPLRTRGDFRGVAGNPHQVLIQQWLPPSSPPLAKGGRVREQRASARTHEFFHTFRGAGVDYREPERPTPKADAFCPSQEGISKGICIKILIAGLAVMTAVATGQAQDWLQWRGPSRDGGVTAFSEPKIWPEALKLKWKIPVGMGHSSPVVVDGRVYLHTRQEEREVVSCHELESAKLVWQESYPVPYTMNPAAVQHGKGPKSTPVVFDRKVYTLGISGILSCFELKTGKLRWRREFSREFKQTSPLYGTSMSPVVEAGLLIAHVGGHDQGALTAFNAETGETKWNWKGDGPGHASPIVADLGGMRQVVTLTQSFLVGVDAANGKLLWSLPFKTEYDQNIVTPLLYHQTLIYSGVFQPTLAIRINKKGTAWTPEKVWENREVSMYMNSPVVSGDLLFGMSHRNKGQFFCLDGRTGSTLWTSQGRQGENAAILIAGDVLFLLTNDAELIVARKNGEKFEPIRRYSVAQSPTWAHPVILGHQILIKDASSLALWSLD